MLTKIVTTDPSSTESFDAEERIEILNLKWKLEHTGFPKLLNACKQMQDSLRLTSFEADRALDDAQRASEAAAQAEVEAQQRKKKIYSLHREKIDLQKKNKSLMEQKKLIARSVRKFVDAMTEEHNGGTATLSLTTQKSVSRLQLIDDMNEENNDRIISTSPDAQKNIPQLQYVTSGSTSEEGSEDASTVSSSALVTDDGCATVRFTQRLGRKCKIERVNFRTKNKIRQRNVLELSFPSKNDIGLQFSTVSKKVPR